MKKKIFCGIFVVSVLTFLACLALILGVLYSYFDGQLIDGLHTESSLIATGVETGGADYLNSLGEIEDRITWVAPDGEVLYDNQANAAGMENHLDREEVVEALESGRGESERTSETLSQRRFIMRFAFLTAVCFESQIRGRRYGTSCGEWHIPSCLFW